MSIVDSVKRAPRWAWLTAAGVGIGAGAIKLYRDRAAPPAEVVSGEVVDGGALPVGTAAGSSAGYPGVVVPPVIIGGNGDDPGAASVGVLGDIFGGFAALVAQLSGGDQGIIQTQTETIGDALTGLIANAGGPPGQTVQNPTPVVINLPAPQPAPVALPTAGAPRPAAPSYPAYGPDRHTLCWWQNPRNASKDGKGRAWKWPGEGNNYSHSRPFEGHQTPSGSRTQNCV